MTGKLIIHALLAWLLVTLPAAKAYAANQSNSVKAAAGDAPLAPK